MFLLRKIKDSWLSDPKRFVVHAAAWVVGLLFSLIALSALTVPQPNLVAGNNAKQSVVKPLTVKFFMPPTHKDLKVKIEPDIPVSVKWSGGFFGHFSRTMIITPESSWDINTNYTVTFSGLKGVVRFGREADIDRQFITQTVPGVDSVSVSSVKDVLTSDTIDVSLTQSADNFAEFFFTLNPPAEFEAVQSGDSYSLNFLQPLKQGQEYSLTIERQLLIYNLSTNQVERRLNKEVVSQTTFKTRAPALIDTFSPQGSSVLPASEFVMKFTEDMDRDSVTERLSLEPKIAGNWEWQNDKTLVFKPSSSLELDSSYALSLKSGAKAVSGSFIEGDNNFSFKTVGNLRVSKTSPVNGGVAFGLGSNISITFDQPPIRSEVEKRIAISPSVKYSKSWNGNTLTINPTGLLNYYTKYSVSVASGAGSQYGKSMASKYSFSFTTELKKVVLNIPLDKQDRALSCEAASLKMALNYRGLNLTESNIMALVGYDPTVKNGNVWGDPNIAFVGNIDGSQNSTGYGVHWDPIARAASNWRKAEAFSGWTVSQLAWSIEAGNPVVIWGVLGSAYSDPWNSSEGKYIAAWKGEHVRTLIGYTGSPDNPASFIINDPIVGRVTWSTNTLKNDWAKFNNSGVVVY